MGPGMAVAQKGIEPAVDDETGIVMVKMFVRHIQILRVIQRFLGNKDG